MRPINATIERMSFLELVEFADELRLALEAGGAQWKQAEPTYDIASSLAHGAQCEREAEEEQTND